MRIHINNLVRTDSYKVSHWKQLPLDTIGTYSYQESRGGMFDRTLMFGESFIQQEYLEGPFYNLADVKEADEMAAEHFGRTDVFNRDGWTKMYEKYGGVLPIRIQNIPEGHLVDTHNALMTVQSTDEEFAWLTSWVETLKMKLWYPVTVATLSWHIRQIIGKALVKTGTIELLPYKLHDFGYRGVSSEESAAIGGMAHLVSFQGTDTMIAIPYAKHFYGHPMAGFSIPAMEHTTIIAWGKDFEAAAYENMLKAYPTGLIAGVSDSYDLKNAVENIWGRQLRDEVISRKGTLVVRPDSGDPLETVLMVLNLLAERFGYETNSKGYKVLPPTVRVIQGDGINYHSILQIVRGITEAGWSMDNLALGMGGALLQQVNRDTQRFAYKLSAINRGGEWLPVSKSPKTDPTKASKGGMFEVSNASGHFVTIAKSKDAMNLNHFPAYGNMLETTFENGKVLSRPSLKEIRNRAYSYDTF